MQPITKTVLLATALYILPSPIQIGLSLYGVYSIYQTTTATDLKKNLDLLHKVI